MTAFEKDRLTGLLLSTLHPNDTVHVEGFERIAPNELGKYDLAISNIPFGDTKVFDPIYSNHKSVMKRTISKSLHGYFMQKGLDAVRDGGMVAFITTRNYLDSQNVYRLNLLFEQADLSPVHDSENRLLPCARRTFLAPEHPARQSPRPPSVHIGQCPL